MLKMLKIVALMFTTLLITSGCTNEYAVASQSEKNITLIRRFYREVINERKLHLIDEMVAENIVDHENFPGLEPARAGVKQFFRYYLSAFPDLYFQIDDIFATGDKVITRVTIHGTHQGEFFDISPSGQKMTITAIDIFRIENNLLAEHWGVTDNLTMMQQLGAFPAKIEN